MADLYTVVDCRSRNTGGYMCNGRRTRAEAIAQARAHWEAELAHAQLALATLDEQWEVRVVRGVHVRHLVEELKP